MKTLVYTILLFGLTSCINGNDSLSEPPIGLGSEEPFLVSTDYGLILSWMEPIDGEIHLRFTIYNGLAWSPPKTIAKGTSWFVNWADFPAIIANEDKLFAHFLKMSGENTFDYDIMYTTSVDRGKNWSAPLKLHADTVKGEHGFVSGIPYKEGFAVSWLDGRYTKTEALRMSLRGAIIDDTGTVTRSFELDSMTCDCCPTAMAMGAEGAVVYYRDRTIDAVRDISTVAFTNAGISEQNALFNDNWVINACPVNGPAVDNDGSTLAVAWFSGTEGQFDVKLKISSDGGLTYKEPVLVDGPESLGRLDVQLYEEKIYLTYMTRKDASAAIMLATYNYSGELISKVPLASVSPERGTGFPRTAIWENKLVVAWTDVEEARIAMLAIPTNDNAMLARAQ